MVDLRHTLGNLKYLLTVITEGKGEIPGRKRGLMRALNGSLRSGSRDSSLSVKASAAMEKASRADSGKVDRNVLRRVDGGGGS